MSHNEATSGWAPSARWQAHFADALLALGTAAAGLAMAFADGEPNSAAEARMLAVLAPAVLFAVFLVTRDRWVRMIGPVGVTVAIWTLPNAPIRGATVTALLASVIAIAAWRLVARESKAMRETIARREATSPATPQRLLSWGALVTAIQLCLSADLILPLIGFATPSLAEFATVFEELMLVPALAAFGLAWLARVAGVERTLFVLSAMLACGGRLDRHAVFVLLALVLGSQVARNTAHLDGKRSTHQWTVLAALLALVAVLILDIGQAVPLVLAGLALALVPGQRRETRSWLALMLVAAGLLALSGDNRPWPFVGTELLLLIPWLAGLVLPDARRRAWVAFTALVLAVVSLRTGSVGALLPSAGLLALGGVTFAPVSEPEETTTAGSRPGTWQHATTIAAIVLIALALLAGAYPWLRAMPVHSMRAALQDGLAVAWRGSDQVILDWPPQVLTKGSPQLSIGCSQQGLPAGRGFTVIMHSMLDHAADLPIGSRAGELHLATPAGEQFSAPIIVGRDTGEWSRSVSGGSTQAEPFVRWISADGSLGRRYRGHLDLAPDQEQSRSEGDCQLTITRSDQLPETTALTLYRLSINGTSAQTREGE